MIFELFKAELGSGQVTCQLKIGRLLSDSDHDDFSS